MTPALLCLDNERTTFYLQIPCYCHIIKRLGGYCRELGTIQLAKCINTFNNEYK